MKKFQTLMKSRFENAKQDNKGFSLVELIIAVVILGIIAVVAIGGLYGNVTKSRQNTDVSNARDIQSSLSTLSADKDVYTWANAATAPSDVTISWSAATANSSGKLGVTVTNDTAADLFSTKIAAILTDGLPEAKAGGHFKITIHVASKGNATITCKAYTTAVGGSETDADLVTAAE